MLQLSVNGDGSSEGELDIKSRIDSTLDRGNEGQGLRFLTLMQQLQTEGLSKLWGSTNIEPDPVSLGAVLYHLA